jgi:hypothetical protein
MRRAVRNLYVRSLQPADMASNRADSESVMPFVRHRPPVRSHVSLPGGRGTRRPYEDRASGSATPAPHARPQCGLGPMKRKGCAGKGGGPRKSRPVMSRAAGKSDAAGGGLWALPEAGGVAEINFSVKALTVARRSARYSERYGVA